jgi:hypothetical protein
VSQRTLYQSDKLQVAIAAVCAMMAASWDSMHTLIATNAGYPSCSPIVCTSESILFDFGDYMYMCYKFYEPSNLPSHFSRYSGVIGSSLGGASSTGCLGAKEPFLCSSDPVPVMLDSFWIGIVLMKDCCWTC